MDVCMIHHLFVCTRSESSLAPTWTSELCLKLLLSELQILAGMCVYWSRSCLALVSFRLTASVISRDITVPDCRQSEKRVCTSSIPKIWLAGTCCVVQGYPFVPIRHDTMYLSPNGHRYMARTNASPAQTTERLPKRHENQGRRSRLSKTKSIKRCNVSIATGDAAMPMQDKTAMQRPLQCCKTSTQTEPRRVLQEQSIDRSTGNCSAVSPPRCQNAAARSKVGQNH